jgi:hypothetical protein
MCLTQQPNFWKFTICKCVRAHRHTHGVVHEQYVGERVRTQSSLDLRSTLCFVSPHKLASVLLAYSLHHWLRIDIYFSMVTIF